MLKIAEKTRTTTELELVAEGKITKESVKAIKTECEKALLKGLRLVIDMADVSFADRPGVALLKELQERHVRLKNCSLFLSQQLNEARK